LDGLDGDHVVRAHEVQRGLVVEVAALSADVLMLLRAQRHGFAAAFAALRAAGDPPLGVLERPLGRAKVPRREFGISSSLL
jgi:hypothetical protein